MVGTPVAAVVTTSVWRTIGYALATGRAAPTGVAAGSWLGTGLVIGELTSGFIDGPRWFPSRPEVLLFLLLAAIVFVVWVTQCARLRLASWRGGPLRASLGVALAAGVLVAVAGLDLWLRVLRLRLIGDLLTAFGFGDSLTRSFPGPWDAHRTELSLLTRTLPALAVAGADQVAIGAAVVLWLFPLVWWTWWAPRGPGGLPGLPRLLLPGLAGGAVCLLGIVAVMAHQHSWQPPAGELRVGAFALLYAWWTVVAIWVGAAVTAFAVAATARRYHLLRALLAAGLAQVVALAGLAILASVDGCLGPLRTMGDSCHVLPAVAWPLLVILAGPALAAIFGAALVAGLGAVLAAPVRRLAARRRPAARSATAPRGRARWAVVAVICGGALVASGTASYGAKTSSTGGLAAAVPAESTSTAGPKLRAMQLLMWWKLGGQAHVLELTSAYQGYNRFIQELAAARPGPTEPCPWTWRPCAPDARRCGSGRPGRKASSGCLTPTSRAGGPGAGRHPPDRRGLPTPSGRAGRVGAARSRPWRRGRRRERAAAHDRGAQRRRQRRTALLARAAPVRSLTGPARGGSARPACALPARPALCPAGPAASVRPTLRARRAAQRPFGAGRCRTRGSPGPAPGTGASGVVRLSRPARPAGGTAAWRRAPARPP